MKGLIPKENEFYVLLKECAKLTCESSAILQSAVENPISFQDKMAELNAIEHSADELTKSIIMKLNKTLVTPMDREDIYSLATNLEDIVDFIQGALERMIMYKASKPSPGVQELVRILHQCVQIIKISFDYLPNTRTKMKSILENTEKIHSLESEGDRLYRLEVAKLFEEETNPIEVIKWKEILEHLEDAVDRCEDLNDSIKGVVIKYA
ncbi:MAG: hypothetical protein AWM53_00866 [Candidatus Dichloromethanomonas elyunquensis]|nr:MAG: hypothetical protein AWM53_00866 [Candidatus Dichloromethanomonas elyunquensis]